MSGGRVPTVAEEDQRRLHRERERLLKERGAHSARIKSLLVTPGIRISLGRDFVARLEHLKGGRGDTLGEDLKAECRREVERYQLAHDQIKLLAAEQKRRAKRADNEALKQINQLMLLKGVGWHSSWLWVMEFFGWREFSNRRERGAGAGLTPTPDDSGIAGASRGAPRRATGGSGA